MERLVVNCETLKHMDKETPNVNVHGIIQQTWPGKAFHGKTTQFFLIKDETGSVGAKITDAPFNNNHVGCDVEINGATWTSYFDKTKNRQNWYLDATKAEVKYQDPSSKEAPSSPSSIKRTPEEFDKSMYENMLKCFKLSGDILTDPEISKVLHGVVDSGWSTEDFRTLATSLFIETNRNKGFIR